MIANLKKNTMGNIIKETKKKNRNKKEEKKMDMNDVLNQLSSGKIKLRKTIVPKKNKQPESIMNEMVMILRRRIALVDGN